MAGRCRGGHGRSQRPRELVGGAGRRPRAVPAQRLRRRRRPAGRGTGRWARARRAALLRRRGRCRRRRRRRARLRRDERGGALERRGRAVRAAVGARVDGPAPERVPRQRAALAAAAPSRRRRPRPVGRCPDRLDRSRRHRGRRRRRADRRRPRRSRPPSHRSPGAQLPQLGHVARRGVRDERAREAVRHPQAVRDQPAQPVVGAGLRGTTRRCGEWCCRRGWVPSRRCCSPR